MVVTNSVGSGPKFTGHFASNAEGISRDHISFQFSISCPVPKSGDIHDQSLKSRPKFCTFLANNFFGGGECPRIFGLNLSNQTSFRSCSKVSRRSVDGRRTAEGTWRKKEKHHGQNRRPPVLTYIGYGRPINDL